MNPGAYRQAIQIIKNGYTTDDIGNQTASRELYLRCRAYVNNLSGREYWEAAQVQSENTVIFTLRYCKALSGMNTREYMILWGDKEYNITNIDNVQNKNETVKIRAVAKGQRDGKKYKD